MQCSVLVGSDLPQEERMGREGRGGRGEERVGGGEEGHQKAFIASYDLSLSEATTCPELSERQQAATHAVPLQERQQGTSTATPPPPPKRPGVLPQTWKSTTNCVGRRPSESASASTENG